MRISYYAALVFAVSLAAARADQWTDIRTILNSQEPEYSGNTNYVYVTQGANCPNSGPVALSGNTISTAIIAAGCTGDQPGSWVNLNQFARQVDFLSLSAQVASLAGGLKTSLPYYIVNSTGPVASATGKEAVGAGSSTNASGDYSIAIGYASWASGDNAIAIGKNAVSAANSVVVGGGATDNGATGVSVYGKGASTTSSSTFSIAVGDAASVDGMQSVALGYDASTTADNAVALGAGAIANEANTVSVGSVGHERKIVNVAAGNLSFSSTDAVNGSQLYATNQQVASNTFDIATNTSNIAINANDIVTLQTDVATNTNNIATNASDIATNKSYIAVNTANIAVNTTHIAANTTLINNINNSGTKYFRANTSGRAASPMGADSIAAGDGSSAGGDDSIAIGHSAATSASNSVAVGANANAARQNSVALGANSVADEDNTVSVGSPTNNRRITNVAPGINYSDTANVGQLQEGLASTLIKANSYTDSQIDKLRRNLASRADGGTAAALAVVGIPQANEKGRIMIGAGVGMWRGEAAIAVGGSATLSDGYTAVKAGATFDSHGGSGFNAGIGFQF